MELVFQYYGWHFVNKQSGKIAKYAKVIGYTLIEQSLNYLALHYSNGVDMPCNNISFQVLVDYFDNAHENNA